MPASVSPPPSGGLPLSGAKALLSSMMAETAELEQAAGGPVTEVLAAWLSAQYLPTLHRLRTEAGEEGLEPAVLHTLCADVAVLRHGDQSAARLRLDRERFALEQEQTRERQEAHFKQWLQQPGIADKICGTKATLEEKARRMREIFGLPPPGEGGLSSQTLRTIETALGMG
jgi:hypothetical protein